ncbi:MAG: pilus assembly PilX N-terminal domain-containing protein [Desulfobulbaceae bacterium]|nr:pilus assembly PilX N-terminal domain-containing protein [Desulfobulbaceae bacterium]
MKRKSILQSEQGFVLVAAIMVLLILVVLGISATNTTILETQIAGNEKVGKITFYEADGGTEIGSELLEQNISCPTGFGDIDKDTDGVNGDDYDFIGTHAVTGNPYADLGYDSNMQITVLDLGFWDKGKSDINTPPVSDNDNNRDFFYPAGYTGTDPHTNITVGGDTEFGVGGAMQQAAGYEGIGKGAAGSGASILYDVFSQAIGDNNSESCLCSAWRHVIGQEGSCKY